MANYRFSAVQKKNTIKCIFLVVDMVYIKWEGTNRNNRVCIMKIPMEFTKFTLYNLPVWQGCLLQKSFYFSNL